jgi:ubiquinone/menaquinone biosynthesis C-methylase UbiE
MLMPSQKTRAASPLVDFLLVSELAGQPLAREQMERMHHRYAWAVGHCEDKDVVEVACGSGPGLGMLAIVSRSLEAGDYSLEMLDRAKAQYGSRIPLHQFDAVHMPFGDASKDVIILFEAIYYISSAQAFVRECRRVLRPGGAVLVVTANKDLYDFNPSPFSYQYYGVKELGDLFGESGFSCDFYGNTLVTAVSWRQRILRPVKTLAVRLGVMPKTMAGKTLLRRLVFGKLTPLAGEIRRDAVPFIPPTPLMPGRPNNQFKVIYLAAILAK